MILVTAFKPFGQYRLNSSFEALSKVKLDNSFIKAFLSVDLSNSKEELETLINRYNPTHIIHFGQAPRDKISIEKRAINNLTFIIKDNGDNFPQNEPIIDGNPEFLYTKIDSDSLYRQLKHNNIHVELSLDAGKFICNYVYYLSLNTGLKSIFIHLPLYKGQEEKDDNKSLDLNELIKAIELIANYIKDYGN